MKNILTLLILLIILCGSLPAVAADWYRIELVLFARDGGNTGGNERWPDDPGLIEREGVRIGSYGNSPRGEWRLTGEKQRLARAGMTPLVHRAWAQPVYNRRNARSVPLRSNSEIAPGVPRTEGLIKVSVNRYLHVELDMLLRDKARDAMLLPGEFQAFRFKQHRRMRSKELHYIDHPLMGVLIEIVPIQKNAESKNEPAETDAEPEAAATATQEE